MNEAVQSALNRFPNIEKRLRLGGQERSELEIVRLLGNTHYEKIQQLVGLIDTHLGLVGDIIGKNLLHQNDPLNFRRLLSELYLLSFFLRIGGLNAKSAVSKSGKIHDIDLGIGTLQARIEISCPMDYYGFQFVERYSLPVFRYSECPRGFHVFVEFVPLEESRYYAYKVANDDKNLRKWLKTLESEVQCWLVTAGEGSIGEFEGVGNAFRLRATLKEVYQDSEDRFVEFSEPTRSNDTRWFFEEPLTAEDTARSQIGRKINDKLEKRQCGEPSSNYLRILVVDLSLMDAASPDWFCWPRIANRMDETVRILTARAGSPLPFDVVIPARLDFDCCFGKAVMLDQQWEVQSRALLEAAGLDRQCAPPVLEPPPPEFIIALTATNEDYSPDGV